MSRLAYLCHACWRSLLTGYVLLRVLIEEWWSRYVCDDDPWERAMDRRALRERLTRERRIAMTPGRDDAEIVRNLLAEPATFARVTR